MSNETFKIKNGLTLTPIDLATLTSPQSGDLACDINDSNKIKRYDSNSLSWSEVGAAGVGGVDILFSQDFESASLSSFTQTGLSLSQVTPLHGKVSALMTHQTGVSPTNDQKFKQVIAVDEKFRGQAMLLELNVKSTASAGNVTLNVYDETNAANIVASEQLTLSSATGGIKVFSAFTIPATCLSLSYTITALPEAGSPVTRIDDILCQLNNAALLETSVTVPVITTQYSRLTQTTTIGTSSPVIGVLTTNDNTGIFSYNSGTGVYTLLKDASVEVSATLRVGATQIQAYIEVDGSYAGGVDFVSTAGASASTSWSGKLLKNQTIRVLNSSGAGSSDQQNITVLATAYETLDVAIPLTQSGIVQEPDSVLEMSGSSTIAASATYTWSTVGYSKGSAISYDNGTGRFTASSAGIYDVTAWITPSSASGVLPQITKNSGQQLVARHASLASTGGMVSVSASMYLNVGDYFFLSNDNSLGGGAVRHISIVYQGSLKQVTVNTNSKITIPTSELRFEGASSRGTGADAGIVRFSTMAKIRGDAFTVVNDATLGTAITMTKAGKLDVSTSLYNSGFTNQIQITKNQAVRTSVTAVGPELLSQEYTGGTEDVLNASWSGFVNIGDVIRVAAGDIPALYAGNNLNLSFQEQDIQVSVSNTLPQFSESDSCVRLSDANGFGSSATTTRRFASVAQNIGTDIEYIDSPTLGGQFRAKVDGIYNVSFSENSRANQRDSGVFIRVNGTVVAFDNQIYNTASVDGKVASTSWSGYLDSEDIVTGTTVSTNNGVDSKFTMSKVGKPNVTGVDVTPFVNVPQPVSQSSYLNQGTAFGIATITGALSNIAGSGIYSYNSSTGVYTLLKSATVSVTAVFRASASLPVQPIISTSTYVDASVSQSVSTSNAWTTGSFNFIGSVGETFIVRNGLNTTDIQRVSVTATAASDSILTAPETFSTDTTGLTYAGSGTYTLSTLANAPVGTFITYTYASNTNTRTQTTTAPTQTTADMNANGMLIYTRAYNAASTAAQPAAIAIQIGKGLKGKSLDLYKSAGKVTAGSLDYYIQTSLVQVGFRHKTYNEVTGVLYVDAGNCDLSTNTENTLVYSDLSAQTSGYLVINASKNPALVGVGIDRVAARGVNSAGTSYSGTAAALVFDSVKTYDTHGALNTATGVFTCPVSGYYQASSRVLFASAVYAVNQSLAISFSKNGTTIALSRTPAQTTSSIFMESSITDIVYLNKGDTLTTFIVNERGATALQNAGVYNYFSIAKISGIN